MIIGIGFAQPLADSDLADSDNDRVNSIPIRACISLPIEGWKEQKKLEHECPRSQAPDPGSQLGK